VWIPSSSRRSLKTSVLIALERTLVTGCEAVSISASLPSNEPDALSPYGSSAWQTPFQNNPKVSARPNDTADAWDLTGQPIADCKNSVGSGPDFFLSFSPQSS